MSTTGSITFSPDAQPSARERTLESENIYFRTHIADLQGQIKTLLAEIERRDRMPSAKPVTAEECQAFVAYLRGLKNLGVYLDNSKLWNPSTIKWWTTRGMPPAVQLMYQDRIEVLRHHISSRA